MAEFELWKDANGTTIFPAFNADGTPAGFSLSYLIAEKGGKQYAHSFNPEKETVEEVSVKFTQYLSEVANG